MLKLEYQTYLLKHSQKQNKGVQTKDSEKTKTYKAEWEFRKKVKVRQFESIEEAQKYADKICKSATWEKIYNEKYSGTTRVSVQAKKRNTGRNTAGWASGSTITLDTRVGLDEYTLLHEMSHCAGNWHHGRSFRYDLLRLMSRFMGKEAANVLKKEFRGAKLACGEARQPMTYEQWLASRNRIMKARSYAKTF